MPLEIQYPSITDTVYGVDEIKALDEELLATVCTCSKPSTTNRGCHRYKDCRLPWKGTRPQQMGVRYHHGDGRIVNRDELCRGVEDKRIPIEANKGWVEIIAYEGQQYEMYTSKRKHDTPDPNCHACRKGQCLDFVDAPIIRTVPKHPEAVNDRRLLMFKRAQEARGGHQRALAEQNRREFEGNVPAPPRTEAETHGSNEAPLPAVAGGNQPGGGRQRGAGKGSGEAP